MEKERLPVRRHRTAYVCLLASLLLHLTALYLGNYLWRDELDAETFRVRLARIPPQFKPPRPIPLPRLDVEALKVEMEYLRADQPAVAVRDPNLESETTPPEIESPTAPLALREMALGAKEDAPILERVEMISPSSLGLADSVGMASMDLLRIEDMARANKDHAAVIGSRTTRRDLSGYVNFTQLRVYGAGSGRGALDALSRYVCDHTHLLAQVRDKTYQYFLSEQLLKDPVHFLFEDSLSAYDESILTKFSAEEKALLGRYLREGGFLFIEGTSRRTNRYLREMKDHLREILGAEARLAPIPTSHPIYHSFYEFGGGFPGEDKSRIEDVGDNRSWYYPTNNRAALLALQEAQAATTSGPSAVGEGLPPPEGLWGVELDGELVAVISDLRLGQNWRASFDVEGESTQPTIHALMAGTNILVYALTRKSGITPQLPPPTWMPDQRPVAMVQEAAPSHRHRRCRRVAIRRSRRLAGLGGGPYRQPDHRGHHGALGRPLLARIAQARLPGIAFPQSVCWHALGRTELWRTDPTGGGRSEGRPGHHADVRAQSLCLRGSAADAGAGGTGGLAALVCGLCRLGGRGDLLGRRPRVVGRRPVKLDRFALMSGAERKILGA